MQNLADTRTAPSCSVSSDSIAVTVVVPTRNEARHLARCLDAVRRFSEVYVVDSHSTDSTVEMACGLVQSWGSFSTMEAGRRSGNGASKWIREDFS